MRIPTDRFVRAPHIVVRVVQCVQCQDWMTTRQKDLMTSAMRLMRWCLNKSFVGHANAKIENRLHKNQLIITPIVAC